MLCLWFGGSLTFDGESRVLPAVLRFLLHLPGPLAWMLSALGIGLAATRIIGLRNSHLGFSLAFGSALLLCLDATAGSLGLFGIGNGQVAGFLLLVPGILALGRNTNTRAWLSRPKRLDDPARASSWLAWTITPALATLLLASVSAPGWLWSTEFGGYDALSYHLQLPREWLALGRVETLSHNIYSTLPSFVECAYMHIMAMRGSAHSGALDAQILHALFAVAAAAMVGELARACHRRCFGADEDQGVHRGGALACDASGWCGAALLLGLPWIIVTGSLAYDEMPLVFFFAATLWIWIEVPRAGHEARGVRRGAAIIATSVLCAAAIGAKLTAGLLVVAPLTIVIVPSCINSVRARETTARAILKNLFAASLIGAVVLAPWWIRGLASGTGVFPIMGDGGLTAAQAAVFHNAHGSTPFHEWWTHFFNQFIFAGLSDTAPNTDPWRPFWSILPVIGGAAGIALIAVRKTRQVALLFVAVAAVQIALWLLFTHAKGRFLIPAAVPLVVLAAIAVAQFARTGWLGKFALATAMAVWCIQPLWAYAKDGPAIEGRHAPATGIGLEPLFQGAGGGDGLPVALSKLPPDARVTSLGASAVFWWPMIPGYSTVWNENPIAAALAANPDDPQAAIALLRRSGWTHIVVDETMLDVWKRAGWLDPALAPGAVRALTQRLKPMCPTGGGTLYSLGD